MTPKTTTILCDNCERDLSSSGNSIDYRIALLNQGIPSRGGFVTDVMLYPHLEHDRYFCGVRCMRKFLELDQKDEP